LSYTPMKLIRATKNRPSPSQGGRRESVSCATFAT